MNTSADSVGTLCERSRTGAPSAYAELHRVVRQTVVAMGPRLRRIVPPHGGAWRPEDVDDLVGEFFAREGLVEDLVANPADDGRLKQRIATSLLRIRADQFRSTPLGALRRRIDRRMKRREDVVDVAPRHWALLDHAGNDHWAGGPGPLEAAARRTPVADPPVQRWDSEKQPQATDVASLDAVTTAVLDAAAAPVDHAELKRVVCDRILPTVVDAGVGEGIVEPDPVAPQGAGCVLAAVVWDMLDEDERRLVPNLEAGSRELVREGLLGTLQKSAVFTRQSNLAAKLRPFVQDFDEATEFARCLLLLATDWAAAQGAGQNRSVHRDGPGRR